MGPSPPPTPPSLPLRVSVAVCALSFVGLTIWQIAARRDDWPLSAFEMYSGLQGNVASRSFVKGVSDNSEFELRGGQVGPLGGARLRHLNSKLARNPKRQRRFVQRIQQRYEAQREELDWPVLQGIRSYSESWRIRPGLSGIDRPRRRLNGVLYLPPTALLERLESERDGRAESLPPRAVAGDNHVIELGPAHCTAACGAIDDRYASEGEALRLMTPGRGEAKLTLPLEIDAGRWRLFVRLKTQAQGPQQIHVTLDGKRIGGKEGVGNHRRELGDGAWVWSSAQPGARPLNVNVKGKSPHELSITSKKGGILIDQVWLSRTQRELPIFNDPVQAGMP